MTSRTEATLNNFNEVLKTYLAASLDPSTELQAYRPPAELREAVDVSLPEHGEGESALVGHAQTYLDHSVRTGHWRYMNQLWSGFSLPGLIGEMATAASNTSMFTYEVAPVATLVEKALIKRLCELAGFPNGGGLFVTGGSNANLVALMAARYRLEPASQTQGIDGRTLRLFVSDQCHYSFTKAAHVLGLGTRNVVAVPSDADGRMDVDALRRLVAQERAAGARPFCVGATAGTTVLGAFDPLEAIADVCEAEGLWFHVDGAWGGSVLMSERLRGLMAGCERADSITWDQHKMMGLPLVCSTILMRDPNLLLKMNGVGGEDYIFHGSEDGDLGPMSLQCGRRVDALKLWLAWKVYGREGFAQRIEHLFEMAQHLAARVAQHPDFAMVAPVASLNICFRYQPPGVTEREQLDRILLAARQELVRSGRLLVNFARLGGQPCWRVVLTNFDLTRELVDQAFEEIVSACEDAAKA